MRRRHQPVPVVGKWLRTVVQGYFAYYAVPTNLYRLDGFRSEVCRAWRHALKRRSQRNRQTPYVRLVVTPKFPSVGRRKDNLRSEERRVGKERRTEEMHNAKRRT